MSNWVNGNEVPDLDVTVGEHGEVTSWPDPTGAAMDLPVGVHEVEVDPQAGTVRIVCHPWLESGSDDPSVGPDAARWTPEDDG